MGKGYISDENSEEYIAFVYKRIFYCSILKIYFKNNKEFICFEENRTPVEIDFTSLILIEIFNRN